MSADTVRLLPDQLLRLIPWASSMSIIMLVAGMASAQKLPARVEIGPSVRVSDAGTPHVEPYIAAHPDNSQNLIVIVAHIAGEQAGFVETFSTSDGGKTWSVSHLPQLREAVARKETSAPASNPWVTYAPDGTAYCSTIVAMNRGHVWGRLPVLVYRSRDQGTSWEGPTVIGPFFDRPAMAAAGTGKDKRLFIAAMGIAAPSEPSGVAVLRSDDDGASFRRILLTPDNLGHNALNPVVTPEGLLIVPYVDFPSTSPKQSEQRRQLMHTQRIYVVASRDQGQTFGLPRIVADIPLLFLTGFPEIAVDRSPGRFRGRLYLTWNGEDRQSVTVARSADNGETWLARTIKAPNARPAYFPSLAVSNNGTLGVTWLQHEPEESKMKCWRTYFAASVDGGEGFSAPLAVSSVVSCPDPIANKNVLPAFRERGGHYMGLAAAADGTFHAAWPDCRDGAFQVYTAQIKVRVD